ncbi:glucan phosphoethanolaminetransferase (alkaline phosphatase superfamily) [Pseudoduganella lurida]|uniref:Glucan phosphoethanolaminetransferase (Alkaline phosphatase superfamily) n=1 Tax=Pseudoduganella lurida TaxID=1036180 RepID=A0A562QUN3_9BURK|nr:phosphoethanolamine transferase [Pseudoduganella lurida]TWI60499.1 glucan phosphoethanolaminetransferase (alkaline phosphatase superfamily) [Pseudoduganella lurida]
MPRLPRFLQLPPFSAFAPARRAAGSWSSSFLLLSYLALSAVPWIRVLLDNPVPEGWQILGIEIAAWTAVWALFSRPAWFHWLLIPAFMALPTEIYLLVFYGQGISTHHLGILAETSPMEAMEFLGSKVWTMLAVMALVAAWWVLTFRAARQARHLDWTGPSRWVALGLLAGFGLLATYAWEFGAGVPPAASASASASASKGASGTRGAHVTGWTLAPLPEWARPPVHFSAFIDSWPFGLAARGVDFYRERRYLAELNETSRRFTFHANQPAADDVPETVVMVIGESSRQDRWQLFGYGRETNPLLGQEKNLVTLPDVITSVSATRLSVPVIISRKPARQSLKDGFNEKSFITAYKEAGFRTWWLSNQVSFGKFDTPVSVFAREADVVQFLNLGGFSKTSNHDAVLFEPLRRAMADPAPKKLIVLHTLGSHWNYSQRYPQAFDKWQPSLFGVDNPVYTDLAIKTPLNNSYDNAILYTDWFLAQVVDRLKTTLTSTALVYVADHGQTLYDGTCRLAFHGHNTQFEFRVPAFMWYSDQYRDRYPDKVKQLLRHRKAKLATENMFHTLLDVADIRYPDDRLEWSFLSPAFQRHTRWVDSYGWTDYDNATLKGDCREIIAKKPKAPKSR